MGFLNRLLRAPEPEAVAAPAPAVPPSPDKLDNRIRIQALAVEQCSKGPHRKAELERYLNYLRALKAAQALKPE